MEPAVDDDVPLPVTKKKEESKMSEALRAQGGLGQVEAIDVLSSGDIVSRAGRLGERFWCPFLFMFGHNNTIARPINSQSSSCMWRSAPPPLHLEVFYPGTLPTRLAAELLSSWKRSLGSVCISRHTTINVPASDPEPKMVTRRALWRR